MKSSHKTILWLIDKTYIFKIHSSRAPCRHDQDKFSFCTPSTASATGKAREVGQPRKPSSPALATSSGGASARRAAGALHRCGVVLSDALGFTPGRAGTGRHPCAHARKSVRTPREKSLSEAAAGLRGLSRLWHGFAGRPPHGLARCRLCCGDYRDDARLRLGPW